MANEDKKDFNLFPIITAAASGQTDRGRLPEEMYLPPRRIHT